MTASAPRRTILKVQKPIVSSGAPPMALIYDETRSLELLVPWDDDMDRLFRGRLKIYVEADVTETQPNEFTIAPIREVEAQTW